MLLHALLACACQASHRRFATGSQCAAVVFSDVPRVAAMCGGFPTSPRSDQRSNEVRLFDRVLVSDGDYPALSRRFPLQRMVRPNHGE